MNIVVLKSEEDELLNYCDNSCGYGGHCVCITILGMNTAGQGMYDYGINKCVLCCRRDFSKFFSEENCYPPYRVIHDGYPKEWIITGSFIRFNKNDYIVSGEKTILQDTERYEKCPKTWISEMYTTGISKKSFESTKWFMTVCDTQGCKVSIHSYVDKHRAMGIDESFMDLSTMTVKCSYCKRQLRYINSDSNGLVKINSKIFSQCRFCNTIVKFDNGKAIQICTRCEEIQISEYKLLQRVCLHCGNTVPITKKGGSQTIVVSNDGGSIQEVFLCRHHKIKTLDTSKVYDIKYIKNIIK